jgi:hypothetical protein
MESQIFHKLTRWWLTLIQGYSAASLSIPSDRLPALAALAAIFRNETGFDYVAGHWLQFLPITLLWCHSEAKKIVRMLPSRQRFPSWSWASVEGAILHYGLWRGDENDICAKVLDCYVTELKGRTAVLGEVEAARLRVVGVVHPIVCWTVKEEKGLQFIELRFVNTLIGGLNRSIQLEVPTEGEVTLLSFLTIQRSRHRSGLFEEAGLILRPHQNGFVRVGYMMAAMTDDEANNPFWGAGVEREVFIY